MTGSAFSFSGVCNLGLCFVFFPPSLFLNYLNLRMEKEDERRPDGTQNRKLWAGLAAMGKMAKNNRREGLELTEQTLKFSFVTWADLCFSFFPQIQTMMLFLFASVSNFCFHVVVRCVSPCPCADRFVLQAVSCTRGTVFGLLFSIFKHSEVANTDWPRWPCEENAVRWNNHKNFRPLRFSVTDFRPVLQHHGQSPAGTFYDTVTAR